MSSSAYPIIWAMKHAPVADALERLILIAMADAADFDGCNSYRSMRGHTLIAKDVDKRTISRRQQDMAKRGLIRLDPSPPPARYLRIPADKRPPRWELMIPFSWWSDAQREQIQREREDRGLPPITPESRPDLPDAPPKKARADKGKPNPKRQRREKQQTAAPQQEQERGVSETPRDSEERGVYKTPRGVSTRHLAGCLQDTQPSFVDLPVSPSSSSPPSSTDPLSSHTRHDGSKEEEGSATPDKTAAGALVDEATSRWVGHRLPTRPERLRLTERVVEALAGGAHPDGVVQALTRDLAPGQVRTSAVQVVTARTRQAGWADLVPAPRQPAMAVQVERCPAHPGSERRADGQCGGCWVDAKAVDKDVKLSGGPDAAAEIARAKVALRALQRR